MPDLVASSRGMSWETGKTKILDLGISAHGTSGYQRLTMPKTRSACNAG
jgi:hypothetical protein